MSDAVMSKLESVCDVLLSVSCHCVICRLYESEHHDEVRNTQETDPSRPQAQLDGNVARMPNDC